MQPVINFNMAHRFHHFHINVYDQVDAMKIYVDVVSGLEIIFGRKCEDQNEFTQNDCKGQRFHLNDDLTTR